MMCDEVGKTPGEYMASYLDVYVSLLDDPAMRRVALAMGYAEACNIVNSGMACRTSDEYAIRRMAGTIKHFYAAVADCIYEGIDVVCKSYMLWEALFNLALNISTREDRIIACRQLESYPHHLRYSDKDDETLDENALYVASVVKDALNQIGDEMVRLNKEVKE